jgi:hypothetical protein
MYLINAGEREMNDSKPLERKGQSNDFQTAKKKADKLIKLFAQVEVVGAKTKECVYFQAREVS